MGAVQERRSVRRCGPSHGCFSVGSFLSLSSEDMEAEGCFCAGPFV